MRTIKEDVEEFHKQLKYGTIQRAYRALLSFMMGLQRYFKNKYPDSSVSSLYQGYMDMTYFAVSPPSFRKHDLKCAIVFNYESFRFEAWLAGKNRKINKQYWEIFKDQKLPAYRIVTPGKGIDSIVEYDLIQELGIIDTDALTTRIEMRTNEFIKSIEVVLSKVQAR
jgi:hypothetical protein